MRIVFLGSGQFALPTAAALADGHDLPLVITQPDRPAGRRRQLTPTPVGAWAAEQGIATIKPADVNAADVLERIESGRFDAAVVVDFGQYISQKLTALPRCGAMNLHPSLLPRWRGAAPVNWTIIAGDARTGNTIIRLARKMDAGAMLAQSAEPRDPSRTAGELADALAGSGAQLVLKVLAQAERGELVETPQDEAQVTHARKLSRDDAQLDFTDSAERLRDRIHGLTPWPGVTIRWTEGDSEQALKLCRVEPVGAAGPGAAPGSAGPAGLIATGAGALRILEVQPPGKRRMSFEDYHRGRPMPSGVIVAT